MNKIRLLNSAAIIAIVIAGGLQNTHSMGMDVLPQAQQTIGDYRLLTMNELDTHQADNLRLHYVGPHFPIFETTIPVAEWKNYNENQYKLIDEKDSLLSDRVPVFNHLSHYVETKMNLNRQPAAATLSQDEKEVEIIRYFAKSILWDAVVDVQSPTSFNPLLKKIFDHKENVNGSVEKKYYDYLSRIDIFLNYAIRLQEYLISNGKESVSISNRMLAILLSNKARVWQLKLLQKKNLIQRGPNDDNTIDPDQAFRKDAFDLYDQAYKKGPRNLYRAQMVKLMVEHNYSPTGNTEADKKILIKLLPEPNDISPKNQNQNQNQIKSYVIPKKRNKIKANAPADINVINYFNFIKNQLEIPLYGFEFLNNNNVINNNNEIEMDIYNDNSHPLNEQYGYEEDVDDYSVNIISDDEFENNDNIRSGNNKFISKGMTFVNGNRPNLTINTKLSGSNDAGTLHSSSNNKQKKSSDLTETQIIKANELKKKGHNNGYIGQIIGSTESQVNYATYFTVDAIKRKYPYYTGKSILTAADKIEIKELRKQDPQKYSYLKLTVKYNCKFGAIEYIINGRTPKGNLNSTSSSNNPPSSIGKKRQKNVIYSDNESTTGDSYKNSRSKSS